VRNGKGVSVISLKICFIFVCDIVINSDFLITQTINVIGAVKTKKFHFLCAVTRIPLTSASLDALFVGAFERCWETASLFNAKKAMECTGFIVSFSFSFRFHVRRRPFNSTSFFEK